MRILMAINAIPKGGRERRMLELIKELKKRGDDFDICLISMSDTVDYKYVYDLPIRFMIVKKKDKKDLTLSGRLRKIIKDFNPDIIHSWDVMASGYLTVANMFINKPIINGFIADAYTDRNLLNKIYLRVKLLTPFSTAIVSNSFAGIKAYRTPAGKSFCIYNGVDFMRFEGLKNPEEIRKEIFPVNTAGKFIGVMVGAFEKRKDYPTLIEAAVKLCQQDSRFVFLLIGDGADLAATKESVPAALIGSQIFFPGNRSDVESVLQIADVGLLITPCEGISNSIIEYMASGKPVIATRGGGTDELVQDGINGFLIDQKSPDQIIQKMKMLADDKALGETLGRNGYKWVREQFDVKKVTNSYIELYHRFSRSAKGVASKTREAI